MSYSNLIPALMGHAPGRITIVGADGVARVFEDRAAAGAYADNIEDPWLDLVTDKGYAVGKYVQGNPDLLHPKPTISCSEGAVYLFGGEPVEGMPSDRNFLPLADLTKTMGPGSLDDLRRYLPDDLDVQTPASERTITLMSGSRRDEKQGQWKAKTSTFDQFQAILHEHTAGAKDGPCFLQGESASGARKALAMVKNDILGVDLDSGAPLEQVMEAVRSEGLHAVIYTTHSHFKDTSVIKRDHFLKWCNDEEPTPELCREYLEKVKAILPEIVEDCTILDDSKHTDEGVVIIVKHKPMPKFRAIFALHEPFVFAKRGGPQKDAILEWKERYAGFCSKLGLYFDEKCVDPARLFYLPRHPKGDKKHGAWIVYGDTLNLDNYERVKMKRDRGGKRHAVGAASNPFAAAGGAEDEDDANRYLIDGFNLRVWAAKKATRFEIQTCLEDNADPDVLREERSGKAGVHIACPYEAEHSSFGGNGTFLINSSDAYDEGSDWGFTVVCTHNACSGRDRLDFVKGMIEEGYFETKHLDDKAYLIEVVGEEDDDPPYLARSHDALIGPSQGKGDAIPDYVTKYNKTHAIVRSGGKTSILIEPRSPDKMPEFYSFTDARNFERPYTLPPLTKGGDPREEFVEWYSHIEARRYTDICFNPAGTPDDTYNLFGGFPVEARAGDWSILRGHIFDQICDGNEDHFEWLMDWLADIIQNPEQKLGSSIVVSGEKGTGKSVLFDHLSRLLGRCSFTASQRSHIVGKFNGQLECCLLLVCEEAVWAGDKSSEGVLKDLITGKTINIERKYFEPRKVRNYTRLAFVSNEPWVVPASFGDERRFFVLKCNNRKRGDHRFFEEMEDQMRSGGLEAMMHELRHRVPKSGWVTLRSPPHTEGLHEQMLETLTGIERFMYDLLMTGLYEPEDDTKSSITLNDKCPTVVLAVELRAAIGDYLRDSFGSDRNQNKFPNIKRIAADWCGARVEQVYHPDKRNRTAQFIFPPLPDAREYARVRKGARFMDAVELSSLPAETNVVPLRK